MKKQFFFNSKGYTLVEMLAVIIVFSIIGGIMVVIFTSSLRGSNKANITNEVRQGGNYALSQMAKMITYAKSFEGISVEEDGYIGDCYIDSEEEAQDIEYHYLMFSNFDEGETTFTCSGGDIASNGASLIDEEIIKIDDCKFYCSQPSLSQAPTIKISFTLSQKSESKFFEQKASIPFETTVMMRNISR